MLQAKLFIVNFAFFLTIKIYALWMSNLLDLFFSSVEHEYNFLALFRVPLLLNDKNLKNLFIHNFLLIFLNMYNKNNCFIFVYTFRTWAQFDTSMHSRIIGTHRTHD